MKRKYNLIEDYLNSLPEKLDILNMLYELRNQLNSFHRAIIVNTAKRSKESLTAFVNIVDEYNHMSIENNLRTDLILSESQIRLLKCIMRQIK